MAVPPGQLSSRQSADDVADPTASTPPFQLDYWAPFRRLNPFARHPTGLVAGPATIRLVLLLALPTIVEQVLQAGIGLTDTIVAGHTGTTDAQRAASSAAIGTMAYLQWFFGIMTAALGTGATAIVARSIGAGRPRVANRVAGTAVSASLVTGIILAILLFAFAPIVVPLCGLRDQAAQYAVQYLQIMVITICLQTASQIGMACLRGAGDTVRPMAITGAVMLVNLVTSPALTFGWFGLPALQVRGNALGTMLAFLVSGIATASLLLYGRAGLKLQLRHFRIVPHVLWRVMRISLPSWFEGMLLWAGQFFIVVGVINPNDAALAQAAHAARSGVTMAAHNAVLRIESLAFLPGFGFGIAASALVGQYLGANQPHEARRAALLSTRLAFITMTAAAIPMLLLTRFLLGLMVNSQAVIDVGFYPLLLAALAQPGFAVAIVMGGALKGAGETVWPMLSTITGMFVVRGAVLVGGLLLLAHLQHPTLGLIAVWVAIFLDLNYRAAFNAIVFFQNRWQKKQV